MKLQLSRQISKNIQISNFMQIRQMGAELFHENGRADRHDEVNSRFSHTGLKIPTLVHAITNKTYTCNIGSVSFEGLRMTN